MARKRHFFRIFILPIGLAVAFVAYAASELLLEGKWISAIVYEGDWHEAIRVLSFVVAAALIWLFLRLRYEEYRRIVESADSYGTMLEKSQIGIVIYRDERVLFLNQRIRMMLGYRDLDLEKERFLYWRLVHESDLDRIQRIAAGRTPESPLDLHYECRFVTSAGATIWADVVSFVIYYDSRPAVLVNVYDITDSKRAQEQLVHSTRLAELGEMAASVAHELNQPLTGVRNYARNAIYMLENSLGDEEEVKSNLKLISEQVDRASRIINQMRDLTRRGEREFTRLDVNSIVLESLDFLGHQLRLSGVNLFLELAEGLPPVVGDRVRIEQVVLNIITNARQAMEEVEERRLTVRTYAEEEKPPFVAIDILDTGKGFASEDRERIFAPFYSTKKPGHGTGLGLSISLNIVEEHKGRIEATSESGQGARFTVLLPAAAVETGAEGGG